MPDRYLVSGISPGKSGVGRLMSQLVEDYEGQGHRLVLKRTNNNIRYTMFKGRELSVIRELAARVVYYVLFRLRIYLIPSGSEILLVHPQSTGFGVLISLVRRCKVEWYVMDNSFFCIQSYNVHPVSETECLQCLRQIQPDDKCRTIGRFVSKRMMTMNLKKLEDLKSDIFFLAQNYSQLELLKARYGKEINAKIVGLDVSDSLELPELPSTNQKTQLFDVVFHGHSTIAKGIRYVIEVARLLPNYSFLIPDENEKVSRFSQIPLPKNIVCKPMTWETGLREAVIASRITLNPSLWSAPIEGALLKSAQYNKNVATVKSIYGYERECKEIQFHLRLSRDPRKGAVELGDFLSGKQAC